MDFLVNGNGITSEAHGKGRKEGRVRGEESGRAQGRGRMKGRKGGKEKEGQSERKKELDSCFMLHRKINFKKAKGTKVKVPFDLEVGNIFKHNANKVQTI